MQNVTLVGFGAIGRTLFERMQGHPGIRITHIVVSDTRAHEGQYATGQAQLCTQVPAQTDLVIECAGHQALSKHVIPALLRGVECAVLSTGALSHPGLPEQLLDAAARGKTQLHLLSGAIGGIDAIAAARIAGLDSVTYTGRKPPAGWRGTHAESVVNLDALKEATVILEGSAREAALLYPQNANVAATISLAGLGLDATRVRLIADPNVAENIHEIDVRGAFGQMQVVMRGKPLPNNPKTSALTVLSALRFLHNRAAGISI